MRNIVKNINKALAKRYKERIYSRNIVRPSQRVGIVLQVDRQKPRTIKNFIDSSLIRRSDI